MGVASRRSESISSAARFWASVRENGSDSTNEVSSARSVLSGTPVSSSCQSSLRRKMAIWSKNISSKASRLRAASCDSRESG